MLLGFYHAHNTFGSIESRKSEKAEMAKSMLFHAYGHEHNTHIFKSRNFIILRHIVFVCIG